MEASRSGGKEPHGPAACGVSESDNHSVHVLQN